MKYTNEFKELVVKDYLTSDMSYLSIAQKYSIPSKNRVYEWTVQYIKYHSFEVTDCQKKFTFDFMYDAVKLYLRTDMSFMDISNQLNIRHPSIISTWVKKFETEGLLNPQEVSKLNEKRNSHIRRSVCKKTGKRAGTSKNRECDFKRIEETAFREGSTEQKARIIHSLRESFKLKDLLRVTGFPKSTYMYWQKRFERENTTQYIEDEIMKIRSNHKDYGYRRIHAELRNRGIVINIKKTHRLVKKLELQVKSFTRKSRRYNSYKGKVGKIAPNRIRRRFKTNIPHQKITTDTTEFKYFVRNDVGEEIVKKLYLDPFMDMFNSEIISYGINTRPSVSGVIEALNTAIQVTKDCPYRRTFHSDQGFAYQHKDYCRALEKSKIYQSMSRKGNCYDNSIMENFFGLLKQEIYYGVKYTSYDELKDAIERYIAYYNEQRIKKGLDWKSPVEYRLTYNKNCA